MNGTTNATVRDYLADVERALADLPRHQREEIVAGLREHIDTALADAPPGTVADVLDRLGSPAEIAAEARGADAAPAPRSTRKEAWGIGLLTLGSLLFPVLGWIVGIVIVFQSPYFRRRERWLAVFCPPFGFFPALQLAVATRPVHVAVFAAFLVAPFVTAVMLFRRVRAFAL